MHIVQYDIDKIINAMPVIINIHLYISIPQPNKIPPKRNIDANTIKFFIISCCLLSKI